MKINKLIMIFLIVLLGTKTVFATTAATTQTSFMGDTFYGILNFLNLIWIPFAILAGKIFSNDFVYGTFMDMDIILRKIWNFSKNVSLIILGFIFITLIFGLFIGKTKDIGKNLLKLVLAGVLIPLSWFIIGSLISLSTILLIAVGSFPFKIINSDVSSVQVKYCKKIEMAPILGNNISKDIFDCKEEGKNINDFIEKMNNLAGPLLYIGQSILYLDRNWGILDKEQLKGNNKNIVKAVSIGFFLKLIVLLLFIIPIIGLIIIGLIRIFWLWIYMGFSPFIILDQIFGGRFLGQKKQFKFSQAIGLIFQPVVVVFVMGVALIFLASLRNIMVIDHAQNKASEGLVKLGVCKDNVNSFCIENKPVFEVGGNLLKDFFNSVGGFFGYLIFLILVTLILGSLMEIASKTTEITSSVTENLYKFAKDTIMAVPIIPTGRGGISLGAINLAMKQNVLTRGFESRASHASERVVKRIYDLFGIESNDIPISELNTIKYNIATIKTSKEIVESFIDFLHKTKEKYPELKIAMAPNFQEAVYAYLNKILQLDKNVESVFKSLQILDKDGKKLLPVSEIFSPSKEFVKFLRGVFVFEKDKSVSNFKALYDAVNKQLSPDYIYKPLKYLDSNEDRSL